MKILLGDETNQIKINSSADEVEEIFQFQNLSQNIEECEDFEILSDELVDYSQLIQSNLSHSEEGNENNSLLYLLKIQNFKNIYQQNLDKFEDLKVTKFDFSKS